MPVEHRLHWSVAAIILIVWTLNLTGCGGSGIPVKQDLNDPLGSLPNGIRNVSTLASIQGIDYFDASSGVGENPPFATLVSDGEGYKYALYAFDIPENHDVISISYVLANIETKCWLAFANYDDNKWEWHELAASDGLDTIQFSNPGDYVAPDGNVYWAAVASHGNSVQVTSFTVNHESNITPAFYVPPAGQHTIDTTGLGPQTLLMPELSSTGDEVAPVVLYTKTVAGSTELHFGYYDGTSWQHERLFAPRTFTLPQARWLDDEGVVVVYDTSSAELVDIRVNEWWEQVDERVIPLPTDIGLVVPTLMSMDVDPLTGRLGVAYAVAGDTVRIYWSREDEEAWSDPYLVAEYESESVLGLSFKFDPQGGQPWLAYTHGVADYGSTLTVDYDLEYGRFDGTTWQITSSGRSASPMFVELGFDSNTPQVVFSEIRQDTINIKILFITYPLDVPLFADVITGTFNGTDWEYTRVFESDIDNSFNLSTMTLTLDLDLAPACGWARQNELYYNNVTGTLDLLVDISSGSPEVTPQSGNLDNEVPYLVKDGGSYTANDYFTGDPGMNFSWAQQDSVHACSYILAEEISVEDLLGGSLFNESAVLYWSPES